MKPEKVKVVCKHCGNEWLEPTSSLRAVQVVVYRGGQTVKRRLDCPNCGKGVVLEVPKDWLEDE